MNLFVIGADIERYEKIGVEMSCVMTLFDDESTRKKFTVMDKFEVMQDDDRSPEVDYSELEEFLEFGKTYKFTFMAEEVRE